MPFFKYHRTISAEWLLGRSKEYCGCSRGDGLGTAVDEWNGVQVGWGPWYSVGSHILGTTGFGADRESAANALGSGSDR
jgi:hypothetical protein